MCPDHVVSRHEISLKNRLLYADQSCHVDQMTSAAQVDFLISFSETLIIYWRISKLLLSSSNATSQGLQLLLCWSKDSSEIGNWIERYGVQRTMDWERDPILPQRASQSGVDMLISYTDTMNYKRARNEQRNYDDSIQPQPGGSYVKRFQYPEPVARTSMGTQSIRCSYRTSTKRKTST